MRVYMTTTTTTTHRNWMLLSALAAVCLAGACQSSSTAKPASADVWATVDTREIRRDDVEKAYRGMAQTQVPPSEEEALTLQLGLLDDLISQDILAARAKGLSVEPTDAEVDAALAERKQGLTDEQFQLQLAQRRLTMDDLKRGVRRELSVQKVIEKDVTAKIAVTDDEIANFYNQNKEQFNLTEAQYRIAQIVITPMRDPQLRNRLNDDAGTAAEAKRKFDMLLEKLKAGGDFATLAADYSEDPQSAASGGDVGFVSATALNQAPKELKDVVLRTAPGNVSTVAVNGGYTIIRLLAKEAAGKRELTTPAVRDGIRDLLRDRKEQLFRAAYITAARNDAKVVNHLAKMLTDGQGKLPGAAAAAPAAAPAAAAK